MRNDWTSQPLTIMMLRRVTGFSDHPIQFQVNDLDYSFETLFKVNKADIIGKTIRGLGTDQGQLNWLNDLFWTKIEATERAGAFGWWLDPPGSCFWIIVYPQLSDVITLFFTVNPLVDDQLQSTNGQPGGLEVMFGMPSHDQSDGKVHRIEEETGHFLDHIPETVQNGICVLDLDLTIRHANQIMNQWYLENVP